MCKGIEEGREERRDLLKKLFFLRITSISKIRFIEGSQTYKLARTSNQHTEEEKEAEERGGGGIR